MKMSDIFFKRKKKVLFEKNVGHFHYNRDLHGKWKNRHFLFKKSFLKNYFFSTTRRATVLKKLLGRFLCLNYVLHDFLKNISHSQPSAAVYFRGQKSIVFKNRSSLMANFWKTDKQIKNLFLTKFPSCIDLSENILLLGSVVNS